MVDRRNFFKWGLGTLSLGLVSFKFASHSKLLTPAYSGIYINIDYQPQGEGSNKLVVVDLTTGHSRDWPISLDPHSVVLSPQDPTQCLMVEKWATKIALINLISGKMLSEFFHPPESKRQFIGHALYSMDGDIIFTSEAVFDEKENLGRFAEGFIGVRDSKTLRLIREFPSFGKDPHEMVFLNDGKTMVVCNQGHYRGGSQLIDRNLAFINSETGKLIDRIEIPQGLSPAHLKKMANDDLVIVTRSLDFHNVFEQDQHLMIKEVNHPLEIVAIPEFLKGRLSKELLSLAVDERRGIVATTYPDGKKLIFWDLKSKKFIKLLETGTLTGVTLSNEGDHFFVNDLDHGMLLIDAETLTQVSDPRLEPIQKRLLDMPHSFLTSRPVPLS